MRIDIMTLFTEMCETVLSESILGRARNRGLIDVRCRNIRGYTKDKHKRVDDYPYGGGLGMVMQADPIYNCFESIAEECGSRPHLIYMTPQGKPLTQARVAELSRMQNVCILCGHYEGVDERVIEAIVDEEISVGDYVLTGGELPALTLTDAVARMIPGVLADENAFSDESHFHGLLEYPQYTRPAVWMDKSVPEVLLSGHDANIAKWRRGKSLERTLQRRPDMFEKAALDPGDRAYSSLLTGRDKEEDI